MHKFQQSGYPKYFEPFLRHSVYKTHGSQSNGILIEVPYLASVYESKKHFGLSFEYDAPRIWNDMPDDAHSAKPLNLRRS